MAAWTPSIQTKAKISRQTRILIEQLENYLAQFDAAFEKEKTFGGPSLYFHFRVIKENSNKPVEDKLEDNRFYELIYATLASWGMHRMGDSATKLCDFDDFRKQISSQKDLLKKLESKCIWDINEREVHFIQRDIASLLKTLSISKSQAQLVAGTKVLHHILPDLIPPMDRSYTLPYFGIRNTLPSEKPAEVIFPHLYQPFVQIAKSCKEKIFILVDSENQNWHTSFTKVIDNAIIGSFLDN